MILSANKSNLIPAGLSRTEAILYNNPRSFQYYWTMWSPIKWEDNPRFTDWTCGVQDQSIWFLRTYLFLYWGQSSSNNKMNIQKGMMGWVSSTSLQKEKKWWQKKAKSSLLNVDPCLWCASPSCPKIISTL